MVAGLARGAKGLESEAGEEARVGVHVSCDAVGGVQCESALRACGGVLVSFALRRVVAGGASGVDEQAHSSGGGGQGTELPCREPRVESADHFLLPLEVRVQNETTPDFFGGDETRTPHLGPWSRWTCRTEFDGVIYLSTETFATTRDRTRASLLRLPICESKVGRGIVLCSLHVGCPSTS